MKRVLCLAFLLLTGCGEIKGDDALEADWWALRVGEREGAFSYMKYTKANCYKAKAYLIDAGIFAFCVPMWEWPAKPQAQGDKH